MGRLSIAGLPTGFWAAVAVLGLNDHVLKGSGILPGVVTGKLSDFAGMIVAPVLLCAVCNARTDRVRSVLFGVIAVGFASIKLSPGLASGAGAVLTAIGIPSRIWCDPTDLIAFAVLPVAALLARRVMPVRPSVSGHCAVGLAALACIATSEAGPMEEELRGPFLINWTHTTIELEVARSPADCETLEPIDRTPTVEMIALPPATMMELGGPFDASDAGLGRCGWAEVRVGRAMATVTWDSSVSEPLVRDVIGSDADAGNPDTTIVTCEIKYDDDWAFERAVTVHGSSQQPAFDVGALLDEVRP